MKRTEWLQETRKMRFEEAFGDWRGGRLTQGEAARLLEVSERTFRRYMDRYEDEGLDGLADKRLDQASHRRTPVDEVLALTERYQKQHSGWNIKHFHPWVRNTLQGTGVIKKAPGRGQYRKRRERSPLPGMMLHQDGSRHEWVSWQKWDLIVTMDDSTNEHYSMFFVVEEGTASSFRGVDAVIRQRGLFCSMYTDRGSHYWTTPEAGGKVDKANPTQFGRAMKQLGMNMMPCGQRGRSPSAPGLRLRRLRISITRSASDGRPGVSFGSRFGEPFSSHYFPGRPGVG